jgi:hypothetical protein
MTDRELRPPVFPALERVRGVDRVLHRVQENVDRATREARANPENRGRLVEGVTIPAAGDVVVNHKLGRKPRGFTERKKVSGTPAYTQKTATSRFLILTGTAAGVVDLWVF